MSQKFWYNLGRSMVQLSAQVKLDLAVQRKAPLPAGAKIFAANHPSTSDPGLILTLTPEPMSVLIHAMLFKAPVLGGYLKRAGHVPVVYGAGRRALDEAQRLLSAGRNVAIFPEGEISPLAGGFHRPRSGVARLALASGAPVIPVGIDLERQRLQLIHTEVDGRDEVGTWYFGGAYSMTVGEPLYFRGDSEDRERVQDISLHVMGRIIQLARESAKAVDEIQTRRLPPLRRLAQLFDVL